MRRMTELPVKTCCERSKRWRVDGEGRCLSGRERPVFEVVEDSNIMAMWDLGKRRTLAMLVREVGQYLSQWQRRQSTSHKTINTRYWLFEGWYFFFLAVRCIRACVLLGLPPGLAERWDTELSGIPGRSCLPCVPTSTL